MSQNVQLAATLLPAQAMPARAVRPQAQPAYENAPSPDAQPAPSDAADQPVSRDVPPRAKKDGFDQYLSDEIEKTNPETQSPDQPVLVLPVDSQPLTFADIFAQMQAGVFSARQPEIDTPVTGTQGAVQNLTAAAQLTPQAAQVNPALQAVSADAAPLAPTADFAAVLNNRTADGAGQADAAMVQPVEDPLQKAQASLEKAFTAGQQDDTEQTIPTPDVAAGEPKPTPKPAAGQMPVLPQKAVENTADTPAAENSPVFRAQVTQTAADSAATDVKATVDPDIAAGRAAVKSASGGKAVTETKKTAQPTSPHSVLSADEQAAITANVKQAFQHTIQPVKDISQKIETAGVDPAAAVRAADAVTASRPIEQIAQKLAAEPAMRVDQQIRLTLTPVELGTVRITFREQDDQIVGLVEAQRPQTKKEIEDSLPQLMTAMQNQGLQVRRIEVVQWNAPQQNTRESLSDDFHPAAEREFLQQQGAGSRQSRDGAAENGSSAQEGFESGGRSRRTILDTPDSSQWTSDKGLNLYI